MIVEFKLPDLGESIDSGDVVKLMVAVGDVVELEQAVLELETGKAVVEVPSSVKGRVAAIHVQEGDKVKVGETVLSVETDLSVDISKTTPLTSPHETEETPLSSPRERGETPATPLMSPRERREIEASPGVRRLAREMNVDLNRVSGTGEGGRITEEDVKAAAPASHPIEAAPIPRERALPDFTRFGTAVRKPMSSVRLATAEHMSYAWTTIPQVTQYDSADITELEALRKKYADKVEAMGGKLTLTAILLKVVASALRQFPQFNVSVDMTARAIIEKDYVHVGVAVDTERGLLVPVIRDADKKNIMELAVELTQTAQKAHARQLGPADLEGGTFSITNLGTVGGTHFTPIVNWPEAAILGISRATMEPIWKDGQFVPRLMLQLSLSYDHRVIDGADGARFLRWICEALEQPFFLALEG